VKYRTDHARTGRSSLSGVYGLSCARRDVCALAGCATVFLLHSSAGSRTVFFVIIHCRSALSDLKTGRLQCIQDFEDCLTVTGRRLTLSDCCRLRSRSSGTHCNKEWSKKTVAHPASVHTTSETQISPIDPCACHLSSASPRSGRYTREGHQRA